MKQEQKSEAAETVQTKEIPAVAPVATCSPLFCIDCRHLYNGVFATKLDGLFCRRTLKVKDDFTDLVTGGRDTFTITLCRFERLESGQCGPTAKFWENAEVSDRLS